MFIILLYLFGKRGGGGMVRFLIRRKKLYKNLYKGLYRIFDIIQSYYLKSYMSFKRVKWNSACERRRPRKCVFVRVYNILLYFLLYKFQWLHTFHPQSVTSIWIMIIIMTRSIYLFATWRINYRRCSWCVKIYNLEAEERGAHKEIRENGDLKEGKKLATDSHLWHMDEPRISLTKEKCMC